MGETKGVYSETVAMVDAVLDGSLTEEQAREQIVKSYGVPFGEFFQEELDRERSARSIVAGKETTLEGLVFAGSTANIMRFGFGESFGTVDVYIRDGDAPGRVAGFADLYPVPEGIAAKIFLARPLDMTKAMLWPILSTTKEAEGVQVDSVTLVPWPTHDPAVGALREAKTG